MENNFMETEELINSLYQNRSEIPPKNPKHGQLFMNLQSEIFVFLDNAWKKTEGVKIVENSFDYNKVFKFPNF
jgi:spore maturation protein SpmA